MVARFGKRNLGALALLLGLGALMLAVLPQVPAFGACIIVVGLLAGTARWVMARGETTRSRPEGDGRHVRWPNGARRR
jgi:hypothetical protein